MRGAAEDADAMPAFVKAVEETGQFQVVLNERGGHISGLSYRIAGAPAGSRKVKSSALDRDLSWLNLQRRHGVSYDKERDLEALLERSSSRSSSEVGRGEEQPREKERAKAGADGLAEEGDTPEAALTFAARHYRAQWKALNAGAAPREYLQGRDFEEHTLQAFGVGYAPDAWDALTGAALKAGFAEETLLEAGLAIERSDAHERRARGERGVFDRFRGRILFPFRNDDGYVVGFGARRVDGAERETPALQGDPKYVNSPASALFDKGALLFASPAAPAAIAKEGAVYVVEGYTDALRLHQEGIEYVVALAGTALRPGQARALAHAVGPGGQVRLMFDGDTRAQSARAALALIEAGAAGTVVPLPPGADPAGRFEAVGPAYIDTYADEQGRSWADAVLDTAQAENGPRASGAKRQEAISRYFAAVRRGPGEKQEARLQELARTVSREGEAVRVERIQEAYQNAAQARKRSEGRSGIAAYEGRRKARSTRTSANGYFGKAAIERIRDANPIEEVARDYTELRPSGDELVGLSPFKQETTPSFRVHPEKEAFYDFSTGKGGDVFALVQEVEGLSFPEAARYLRNRARGSSATGGSNTAHKRRKKDDTLEKARDIYAERAGRGTER